jgi:hypothetical protein
MAECCFQRLSHKENRQKKSVISKSLIFYGSMKAFPLTLTKKVSGSNDVGNIFLSQIKQIILTNTTRLLVQ